ncbi:MAG: hypothetical protein KUG78_20400 [Kangiellaceae bacterium]|nr:hypothetical protein [Kangiellaceae bacterium]
MNSIQQLKLAWIESPLSVSRMKKNSLGWGLTYAITTFVLFALFIWLLLSNQHAIKDSILNYLFPKSWHSISEKLADFMFDSQKKAVLSNMVLSGSLVLASICLFPLKEKFSAVFEKEAKYSNGEVKEYPLHIQALEETKLFLLYLTAQSVILWLGYYPFQWTSALSVGLSYLFLFFTFGLDMISPTLQRHRISYSLILKFVLSRPLLVTLFGLLYSAPLLIISHFVFKQESLSFLEMSSILFLSNIVFLSLAIPAGTHLASNIIKEVQEIRPPSKSSSARAYTVVGLLLSASLFLHSRIVVSLHHKSQLLKAEYDLDWSSIKLDMPSLSTLANGQALSNFSVDVVITNPTEFDIIIESSEIVVEQENEVIASVDLNGFELASGEKKRIKLKLKSDSNLSLVNDFDTLFQGWRIDMYIDVWPGIPFMLNIFEQET